MSTAKIQRSRFERQLLVAAAATERQTETLLAAFRAAHIAIEEPDDAVVVLNVAGGNEDEEGDEAPPRIIPPPDPENQECDDDDDNNNSNNNNVVVEINGVHEAINRIRDVDDRRPIDDLTVFQAEGEENDALSFLEFVEVLGQREDEGGRTVRGISLFLDWSALPDEPMERLFRFVLPGHGTLRDIHIHIHINGLNPRFLQMLTENIHAAEGAPLSNLNISGPLSDPDDQAQVVQAIVDMLKRNIPLDVLDVDIALSAEQCQLICRALPHNTNLRSLSLTVGDEVLADTLEDVVETSFQMLVVRAHASYSDGAVSFLASLMKTNELLEDLHLIDLGDNGVPHVGELLDALRTYNFTLQSIPGHLGTNHEDARVAEQFEGYMVRNHRIQMEIELLRLALAALPEREAWARRRLIRALGLARDLPTAVFRILRNYYVNVAAPQHAG